MSISEKAQAMIDELVSACIAFGRQVEPDWQTRIEKARRELRAYIEGLEPRWIPVSERLPEGYTRVLACSESGYMEVDYRFAEPIVDVGIAEFYSLDNVTHWLPLPPNPESPNDTQTQTIVYGKDVSRSVK